MILVFDTETSGLTQPTLPADHPAQPHLVQLGAILATEDGREVCVVELIVRPDGWSIPEQAARVHGITTEVAHDVGVPLATVMSVFLNLRARASELVAFNMDFDELVMRAAVARLGKTPSHPGPDKRTCAMRMAAPIMELPPTARMIAAGFDKFKPPNLMEAHEFFVGERFAGSHSALADARACMRVLSVMRMMEVP